MTPAFESVVTATQAAVAAEAQHTAAQAALAAAEGEADTIRRRILDLERARNAIIVRRREGEHLPGDGPALALLDADKQGLQEVLAERDASVATARVPADAAAAELATARFQLRRAEALAPKPRWASTPPAWWRSSSKRSRGLARSARRSAAADGPRGIRPRS